MRATGVYWQLFREFNPEQSGLACSAGVLMAAGGRGFHFKGGMGYACVVEAVLEGTFHFFHLRQVIDDDMGGQGYFRGAYGPDMEMMDICDARHGRHHLLHCIYVDLLRHCVYGHAQAFRQKFPCGHEDDGGYDEADYRVYYGEAGQADDNAGDHDTGGDKSVGCHVQKGPAGVDVVLLLPHQEPGGEAVDKNAYPGCPGYGRTVDFCRIAELVDALDDDGTDGNEQDDGIEQGDEHGAFPVAVCESPGAAGAAQLEGYHGQKEAEHIAEVMSGVREKPE